VSTIWWTPTAVSRLIAMIVEMVTGLLLVRIAWRAQGLLRFDFYGNPCPISRWQMFARYGCGIAFIYASGLTAIPLLSNAPGNVGQIGGLSVILTGLMVANIGWHHETKPRPFFRPAFKQVQRLRPMFKTHRRNSP
jgi:hypothetical protein